ncbi:B12-binding domain-containing radical SAM protein [bacterium]|nr:MAG: B12-binding domain-containing radical SAM protein [bacterium]
MNIGFVFSLQNVLSSEKPLQYQEEMNFGISYISSFLKKQGHQTSLLVLVRETKMQRVQDYIKKFKPDVLCFTSVASEFPFISAWAVKIKKDFPGIFLLGGGCHISLNPEEGIKVPFDAICVGEGEYPVMEAVKQLSEGRRPSGIKNLWIRADGRIERNPTRPFLNNLDELPFPDRDMWKQWLADHNSRPAILLGRGCQFQCTYCSNHALSRLASGDYVRYRSAENIITELEEITHANQDIKEVYFEVETITINMKWALDLCAKLAKFNSQRKSPLSFGVNLRVTPNANFEPLFGAMQKSNFRFVNIGLESGSERVRRDILKRHYSNKDIINSAKLARQYGLQVHFLNMIGFPGETEDDFKQTIECNRICQPDLWASHSIFFPYPGTEIYESCRSKGLLSNNIDVEMERSKAVLDLKEFPRNRIQHYFAWFDYYVYRGHRPLAKLLIRVFIAKLQSSYRLMRIYRKVTGFGFIKKVKEALKK